MEKLKLCAVIVLLVTLISKFIFTKAVVKSLQLRELTTEFNEELIKRPRCGVTDIHKSHIRRKRYYLGPSKWHKNPVTWNFDHKYGRYYYETDKIRTIIHSAVSEWQRHIPLQMVEVTSDIEADIKISFEKQQHLNVDPYIFDDSDGVILAHAFQSLAGLGGDIHFREDLEWYFDDGYTEQQSENRYCFYATALHELGHSLGLDHSDVENAVMYGYYTDSTGSLSYDDIAGIQHIYGFPSTVDEEEKVPQKFPDNFDLPNKCNTSYDAVALLRQELFIFKAIYLWRGYDNFKTAIKINQMWPQLPDNLINVDAVYENSDGKIMIFVGAKIFIFDATTYEHRLGLSDIGFPSSVRKIDAIFKWAFNGQTYIFSGNEYWRFNEYAYHVEVDYPKRIDDIWHDVYNIDTAVTHNGRLYLFKGINYYEFDDRSMQMKRMRPYVSAYFWMKCSGDSDGFTRPRLDGGNERDGDFIRLGLEEGDTVENIEKFNGQAGDEQLAGEAIRNHLMSELIVILVVASLVYLMN